MRSFSQSSTGGDLGGSKLPITSPKHSYVRGAHAVAKELQLRRGTELQLLRFDNDACHAASQRATRRQTPRRRQAPREWQQDQRSSPDESIVRA